MSKKLIAVAAAAALALTGLVGVAPANATISVSYKVAAQTGDADANTVSPQATAASATALVDVPSNNSLEYTFTVGRSSLIKASVTTVVGQVVKVDTTGKVRVIDAPTNATNKYTSASGLTTWTTTATTTSTVFYVYTTGTDAGSVKTTVGGNSTEVFFKGNVGPAYNIAVTAPRSVTDNYPAAPAKNVQVKVTDVFGNQLESGTPVTVEAIGSGASVESATPAWDSTLKAHATNLKADTAGPVGLSVKITTPPTAVTGLAAPVATFFATVNSLDLVAQVTALEAQVAALQAQLENSRPKANSVTKKRFNTLARKWNAANPSARVALKK